MARSTWGKIHTKKYKTIPKRTSIGKSKNSRPKNKHKKKCWKKYRGKEVDEYIRNVSNNWMPH